MAEIRLHNTLTRRRETFTPLDPARVRMYVCGPTVYDFAHIGNARPVIVFDLLYRLLREQYGEDHVVYVRNITDVDDKINARAREIHGGDGGLNPTIRSLTEQTTAQFRADVAALGCLSPTHEPRATDYIRDASKPLDMVRVIEALIAKDYAYEAAGHVLFHVSAMPGYGALAGRARSEMLAGARVEVAPFKRDPMDFVLWKPSDPATDPGWESPWGFGRPGWHIECSAMAGALLGETFDIHAGGIDLIFPHHENEIAQSCCAFGPPGMPNPILATFWLHNGFLQIEGRKMSKSEGNFRTIREELGRYPGAALRLNMLKSQYREPIDWTDRRISESAAELAGYRAQLHEGFAPGGAVLPEILAALRDDLNTHLAFQVLDRAFRECARLQAAARAERAADLAASLAWLGLALPELAAPTPDLDAGARARIERLIAARSAARAARDWAEADRLRAEITAQGVIVEDGKDAEGRPASTWRRA